MSISNHTSHSRSTSRVVFVLAALILAVFSASAQSTRAATANLVVNGSFEKDTNGDGVPNGWIGFFLDPGDKRVCNQSKAGACSFKLVGDGSYKYIKQQIAHNGTSFDDFTLSGWMKGKDIVTGGGTARVMVEFTHTAGGSNINYLTLIASTPWTFFTQTVVPTAAYDGIVVYVQMDIASGKVWYDKVSLVLQP